MDLHGFLVPLPGVVSQPARNRARANLDPHIRQKALQGGLADIRSVAKGPGEGAQMWPKAAVIAVWQGGGDGLPSAGHKLDLAHKADHLSSGHPFEVAQFQRVEVICIPGDSGGSLRVASAEDTVLAKLEWYKLAPSDRQWRDVQAILRQWAAELAISDLLEYALKGQQPPRPGDDPRQQRLF
jgi:hypothetical protein